MLFAMQRAKHVAAAVFWVGLTLSLALSLVFLAALANFGLQPAPLWARVLTAVLVFMPVAGLITRRVLGKTSWSDIVIGCAMAFVVVGYAAVMIILNQ